MRELTLNGSCASSGEYPACLDLMAKGTINVDPLISAVVPLEEGARWFQSLSIKERMEVFCSFTDLALSVNPRLKDRTHAQPVAGRIQVLSAT